MKPNAWRILEARTPEFWQDMLKSVPNVSGNFEEVEVLIEAEVRKIYPHEYTFGEMQAVVTTIVMQNMHDI